MTLCIYKGGETGNFSNGSIVPLSFSPQDNNHLFGLSKRDKLPRVSKLPAALSTLGAEIIATFFYIVFSVQTSATVECCLRISDMLA